MASILPFWKVKRPNTTSTFATFGFQYDPSNSKSRFYLETIFKLLSNDQSCHVEIYKEPHVPNAKPQTVLVIAYWFESDAYQAWWSSADVQTYWNKQVVVDEAAGVFREVLTVSADRFMHTTSRPCRIGFASVPQFTDTPFENINPEAEKKYWGIYRERLPGWKNDTFASPRAAPVPSASAEQESENMPDSKPRLRTESIQNGRVVIPHGIDNLVWVHEYQDYSQATSDEMDLWNARIAGHARAWIEHLDLQREENGLLTFANSAGVSVATDGELVPNQSVASQFGYFWDLAAFEKSGKSFRAHRQARSSFEQLYKPEGELGNGKGRVHLAVELVVLKKDDLEAEYIGCLEGTGLMPYASIFAETK
ncbi:hypothetical protein NLG97_g7883 [Lecanicillium saksenae]|uniref:Uncharacterized protein n=1 Tax=Lecanicillium saksenae TaxID=468837 RepID=A0ACC1QKI1_9HYPO|nr:hypothetical protein NLG97_g7883 [Lecanicillium saksenae]